MNLSTENKLFAKIKDGDKKAFEDLFKAFYRSLCYYAVQFVKNEEIAEEITQDVFVKVWEKRSSLEIKSSIKNYLYRSVKNQALNLLQHNKIKIQYSETVIETSKQNIDPSKYYLETELAKRIEEAINSLPTKRKKIFMLSREDGLKYKEIAKKLNISIKTVEAQMGLALKSLRLKLKIYDPNLILFHFFFKSR